MHGKQVLLIVASLGMLASGVRAAEKESKQFVAQPAASYATKQVISGVTVAAVPFSSPEMARSAFDKLDPNVYGVLPVLVVIQNDSKTTIRINEMLAQYISANNDKVEPTPAADLPYLKAPERPKMTPSPIPGLGRKKKNPFHNAQLERRGFTAKMLPPGDSASGFLFFQVSHRPGSRFYLTNLLDATTGKELFYFEIPFEQ